ncbi:MAG: LysR family transcriptional regulator [Kiloniellales bacterium]|nr:LysR family transcriptional regulator [Kiloniellales bacterium]
MLELRLLKALVTIAEERSVTRAARRLHITQPAMSATLRKIREAFDDPLFVRSGGGLATTERAEEVLVEARKIIATVEALERETAAFDPATDELELRIEASDFTHSVLLPSVMRILAEEAPRTRLFMQPLALDRLAHSLDEGSLDFAILPAFLAPPALRMRKLFEEDFVCVMRRGHPMDREPFTKEALSACAHLRVTPTGTEGRSRVDRAFEAQDQIRDIRLTVTSYNAVPAVVAVTDLVSLFPRGMASRLGEEFSVHELPIPLEAISMSLIWHPRKQTGRSHRWARELLARAAMQAYRKRTAEVTSAAFGRG